jgi:hypothetical protein
VYSKLLRDAEIQVAAVIPPKVTAPKPAKPAAIRRDLSRFLDALANEKLVKPAVGMYPDLKPGDIFKDCNECLEMVVIPPGRFRMGDIQGTGIVTRGRFTKCRSNTTSRLADMR